MSKHPSIGLFCTKSWQMLETGYALLIVAEMVRLWMCRVRLSRQYGIIKVTLCGRMEAHHALSTLCHLWIRGLVTVYHLNAPKKGALKNVSANIVGHGRVRQWTGILSSFSTFCGRPEQPPTLYLTTFYPRGSSRGQYVKWASQSMTTWTYNPLLGWHCTPLNVRPFYG